jgi:hypothetical protein
MGPLLDNDSVNTFQRKRTLATIARPLISNRTVNKPSQQQRACFLRGSCRRVIKGQRSLFESAASEESNFGMPACRDISLGLEELN